MKESVQRVVLDPIDERINKASEKRSPFQTFTFGMRVHIHPTADSPMVHGRVRGNDLGDVIVRGDDGKEYVVCFASDKIWECDCPVKIE